jgi:diguanylate cyclase (GGDEF)-like protein
VRAALGRHGYVLATDDAGQIMGVVPEQRILERLETGNDRERIRWESMHLGALINVEIDRDPGPVGALVEHDVECVAVTENDALVAITIEDDVFLSLRRLEPTLAAAKCDPLTGLMNRLGYERRLNEEWARATRRGTSLAVIVLDIDHFKQINDAFGHPVGDEVLRNVARIFEATLRSYDVVARYGGDEFVALCLDCQPGDIDIPIRRFQQELAQRAFEYGNQTLNISASIGAAVRHEGFHRSNPPELFAAADECAYHSKRSSGDPHIIEFGLKSREAVRRIPPDFVRTPAASDIMLIG